MNFWSLAALIFYIWKLSTKCLCWDFVDLTSLSEWSNLIGEPPSYNTIYLSSLFSDWSTQGLYQRFSYSFWSRRLDFYTQNYYYILRITNNPSRDDAEGKILAISTSPSAPNERFFSICTATLGCDSNELNNAIAYPVGEWTFFFFSRDPTTNQMFLFSCGSSLMPTVSNVKFNTGQQYNLSADSLIYVGGNPNSPGYVYRNCKCTMSMMRFYRDLYISKSDLMSQFYGYSLDQVSFFDFLLDLDLDSNTGQNFNIASRRISVSSDSNFVLSPAQGTSPYTNVMLTSSQGFLDFSSSAQSDDSQLGSHYLSCNGIQVAKGFTLFANNCRSTSVGFSFRPTNDLVSSVQTLFDISSVLTVEYIPLNGSLNIKTSNAAMSASTQANTIFSKKWNRVLINFYFNSYTSTIPILDIYINYSDVPVTLAKNTITAMPQVGDLAVILCGKTSTLKPISDAAVDIAEFRVLCNSSKAFSEYPANPTSCLLWFAYGSKIKTCGLCNRDYYFNQGICFKYPAITISTNSYSPQDRCKDFLLSVSATVDSSLISSIEWAVGSNSSELEDGRIEYFLNSNPASQNAITIQAGFLKFPITYTLQALLFDSNGRSSTSQSIIITTSNPQNLSFDCNSCYLIHKGSCVMACPSPYVEEPAGVCSDPTILPTFALSNDIITTYLDRCQAATMTVKTNKYTSSIVGAPFVYAWTVSTFPVNATEVERVQVLLRKNLASDGSYTLKASTLINQLTYTINATITNQYSIKGSSQSVVITTSNPQNKSFDCNSCADNYVESSRGECNDPTLLPDFSLTSIYEYTYHEIICSYLGSDNTVDMCKKFFLKTVTGIKNNSMVGTYSYFWIISTSPPNITENSMLKSILDSHLNKQGTFIFSKGSLLGNTIYSVSSTIRNNYSYIGITKSLQFKTLSVDGCCGDGIKDINEECDDGNAVEEDGCSSACKKVISITPDAKVYVKIAVSALGTATKGLSAGIIGGSILSGGAGSAFVAVLNCFDAVILFRYIDVGYPSNVEVFWMLISNNSNLLPNPFSALTPNPEKYFSQRYRFAAYQNSVNFLDSAGNILAMIIFGFIMVILLKAIIRFGDKRRSFKYTKHLKKALLIFEWNNPLNYAFGGQINLALAWLLQFNEPYYDAYGIINMICAVLSIIVAALVYFCVSRVCLWSYVAEDNIIINHAARARSNRKKKKYSILLEEFDTESFVGRYFVLYTLAKNTIMVIIIYGLPQAPLGQCYALFFLQIYYIFIMSVGKPFRDNKKQINLIIMESFLFLQVVLMVFFAINKTHPFFSDDGATAMGWVYISMILGFVGYNLLFISYFVIKDTYQIIKSLLKERNKVKTKKQSRILRIKNMLMSINSR